jgi:hypothetical protein
LGETVVLVCATRTRNPDVRGTGNLCRAQRRCAFVLAVGQRIAESRSLVEAVYQ